MTVQELLDWCKKEGIPLDTHIAVRAKDDFFITDEKVYLGRGYFGNCGDGWEWQIQNNVGNEDPDVDNTPQVLILDSGRG